MVTEQQIEDFFLKKINFIPTAVGGIGITQITDSRFGDGTHRFFTLNNKVIEGLNPITAYFHAQDGERKQFHTVMAQRLNEVLRLA